MQLTSQIEVIGAIVIGLTALFGMFKYLSDHIKEQNSIYSKLNENLIKNTLAIDNLNNYIKRVESDFKKQLEIHEKRLDDHHDEISRLKNKVDV